MGTKCMGSVLDFALLSSSYLKFEWLKTQEGLTVGDIEYPPVYRESEWDFGISNSLTLP